MTNAPADLLSLRSGVRAVTGMSADDTGIVGDDHHDCGYHIGRLALIARGCYHPERGAGDSREDYSVRLQRDREGVTEDSSAFDLGSAWASSAGGRAAWLRFNQALVGELTAGNAALSAIRAVNISTDGTTRHRYDRQNGFAVQSTNDTVTVHTHFEFYRNTLNRRATTIDEIVRLVQWAAGGGVVVVGSHGSGALDVDGQLGPNTIRTWQRIMGTVQDGVITPIPGYSNLVAAVQRHLNSHIGAGLTVDGQGIQQDGRVYATVRALQRYLGTPQDGKLSSPVSECVRALQGRLNLGWF